MGGPLHVLFVCNRNRCRSPTAERLYAANPGLSVMSAGVDADADQSLDREALLWAHRIIVFERRQRSRIRRLAPDLFGSLRIHCVDIPDEYGFRERELVEVLTRVLTPLLGAPSGR